MTDENPRFEAARHTFARRLAESGLDTCRFVDVHDGEKRSTDHTQRAPDDRRIAGNYGVYAGRGAGDGGDGYLVDVDIDDYNDDTSEALAAVLALPETFTVASPHTDGETGGHRYYAVTGDVVAAIKAIADGTTNPAPTWGEVRVENQYVVGPGSQLDGCDKDWCDECATPDGGYYRIANDVPIATITTETLVDVLCADPTYPKDTDTERREPPTDADGDGDRPDDETIADRLERAFEHSPSGRKHKAIYDGKYAAAGYSDRSSAEYALANWLDSWVGFGDKSVVRQLMVRSRAEKWAERPDDSYRDSILSGVGHQDWYADERERADGGGDPVAVLPNAPRVQASANGWDWRTADRGDDALTMDDASERCKQAIIETIQGPLRRLIDALPTVGKTSGAVAAAAETGQPITMLVPRGHKGMYAYVESLAREHGLRAKILPNFLRECGSANGEHGQGIRDAVRDWYHDGATGKEIHKHAENELGKPLPCDGQAGDRCHYKINWQFDPDEYDVLIGHHTHANVPSATNGRTVVFDEFDGDAFTSKLAGEGRLPGAISNFVGSTEGLPFTDYADLMAGRYDDTRRADALAWFQSGDRAERDGMLAFDSGGHAAAPTATFTLLAAAENDLGNGWERATLPGTMGNKIGLYNRETGDVWCLDPPDITGARSVVALDGTPTPELWELALGTTLDHKQILSDTERVEYIREALANNAVRTTDAVKPYSGTADHVSVANDRALLESIQRKHGEKPQLITTATAERAYDDEGLLSLDDNGNFAGSEYAAGSRHYGDVKGTNDLADCRLLAVIGSRHFGDEFVQRWGAFAGEAVAEPDRSDPENRGPNLSYGGGIGDDVLRHMRENETLQAVMRAGRDGNGATVYVHTNTLPDWFPVAAEPEGETCIHRTRSETEQAIIETLAEEQQTTTAALADHPEIDVQAQTVRRHLSRLADEGHVRKIGETKGTEWADDGLDETGTTGDVVLPETETDDEDSVTARSETTIRGVTEKSPSPAGDGETWAIADGGEVIEADDPRVDPDGSVPDRGDDPPRYGDGVTEERL